MGDLVDMSSLPTPIMRPASFDDSMEREIMDDHNSNLLPLFEKDETWMMTASSSRYFLTEHTTAVRLNGSNHQEIISNDTTTTARSQSIASFHPQRITPSQTDPNNMIAPEKRRASDTTNSSIKLPDPKKTRGLECHVKNLSLIFEALSAS